RRATGGASGRRDAGRGGRAVLHRPGPATEAGERMTISLTKTEQTTAPPLRAALRWGPVSLVLRPRMVLIIAVLAVALVGLFCLDVAIGEINLGFGKVLAVLAGGGSRSQRFIVFESRLPRALTAVVVGAALALAGAISQSILHNPLAAPDFLGITSAAALGAVAVMVGTGGATTGW